jgi:hypothetical protein
MLLALIVPGEAVQTSSTYFRVMMRAINLAASEPANRGANNHVRREMLFSHDTGRAHCRSQSVNGHLRERARIFVGDNAGDRPCDSRMV